MTTLCVIAISSTDSQEETDDILEKLKVRVLDFLEVEADSGGSVGVYFVEPTIIPLADVVSIINKAVGCQAAMSALSIPDGK